MTEQPFSAQPPSRPSSPFLPPRYSVLKSRNVDTAVPASAWIHDPRIKAAVIAAPTLGFTFAREALAPITVPIQLWRAANDEITPHPWAAEPISRALPTKPDYVVVPDAGHFAFVSCSAELVKSAPVMCRDAPVFNRTLLHAAFNRAVTTFFRAHLPPR